MGGSAMPRDKIKAAYCLVLINNPLELEPSKNILK